MKLQEQLTTLRKNRNEALERQKAIAETAAEEDRTMDDEESSEFDELKAKIAKMEADIERLAPLMDDEKSAQTVAKSAGPTIIVKRTDPDDEFPGQGFVRRVIAKGMAELSQGDTTAVEVAKHRWGKSHPNLVNWIAKAAVAGGDTLTAAYAGNLVGSDNRYTGDFIEFLKSQTIYDQLPLREVPAHITIKGSDGTATGYWVGEGRPIPASDSSYTAVELTPLKAAAISIITNELIRHSTPSAEMLVRDHLADAITQRVDQTFLSADAAVANVSPAGLLNGVTGLTASGTTADQLREDIKSLYAQFLSDKNARGLHFITTPTLAKSIGLMRNALGQSEFPGIGADGGLLEGDPIHTGDNVGWDSTGTNLILLRPADIYRIGDMGVEVSISRDATIEQATNPTGRADDGTAQSQNMVSMFQAEATAFKIVRPISFARRRANAVQYVTDGDYGSTAS